MYEEQTRKDVQVFPQHEAPGGQHGVRDDGQQVEPVTQQPVGEEVQQIDLDCWYQFCDCQMGEEEEEAVVLRTLVDNTLIRPEGLNGAVSSVL
jgi:hypothetical protein